MNESEKLVNDWVESKKPNTARVYRIFWPGFEAFVNMSAKEILGSRMEDVKLHHSDPHRWRWEDIVKKYYKSFYGDKNPTRTHLKKVDAVRSFFSFYRVKLIFRQKELPKPIPTYTYYEFKLADLASMMEIADPVGKWIVAGGKSLGQRVGIFSGLKREDVEPLLCEEPPITMRIITNKEAGVVAHPCLDIDVIEAAKKLRASRNDENPYMLPGYNGGHMKEKMINNILKKLTEAAHKLKPVILNFEARKERIRFHCFRQFLNAGLQDSGVDKDLRDYILGHRLDDTSKAYTSTQVRQAYIQAQDRLLFPRFRNDTISKVDTRISQMWDLLIALTPEAQLKDLEERLGQLRFSISWDPEKEPKPMIYILQEALKRAKQA